MTDLNHDNLEAHLDAHRVQLKQRSGAWWTVRRNGKTKTWKTRPGLFQIPIKFGLRNHGYITERDLDSDREQIFRIDPKFNPPPLAFSEDLQRWFDNFSQSAAVDMGREGGGDDAECVAEQCITFLSGNKTMWGEYKQLSDEFDKIAECYPWEDTRAAVAKHVRTL